MATPWRLVGQASKHWQQSCEPGRWWTWRVLGLLSLWHLAPTPCLSSVSKAGRQAVLASRGSAASRALLCCSLGRGAPALLKQMPLGRAWPGAKLEGECSRGPVQLCYHTPLPQLQGQPGGDRGTSGLLQDRGISAAGRTAPLRVQPARVVSPPHQTAWPPARGSGDVVTGQMTSHSAPGHSR